MTVSEQSLEFGESVPTQLVDNFHGSMADMLFRDHCDFTDLILSTAANNPHQF